jgi:hypothetical protein
MAAQLAAPTDAWSDELAALVRSVSADDFTLTDDLDGCLDLILVAEPS